MKTRERIIEAARDRYLEHGPAGLSMRKIAADVGVSAPAIYKHFADKEALLVALCSEGFELFTRYLTRGIMGKTPLERLDLTGRAYIDFALEHSAYYRVMFMSPHPELRRLVEEANEAASTSFRLLHDRVAECVASGDLVSSPVEELAMVIWSLSHGLVSLYLDGHTSHESREELHAANARAFAHLHTGVLAT